MANRGRLTIPQPSGLTPRFGAMFTDVLVLGAFGIIIGHVLLGDWCVSLGIPAQLVGLSGAILYTALLDSRIGGGQTLGKRMFAIRVAGADGRSISFARSLGRSVLLWIAIAQPPKIRDIALQLGSTAAVMASHFLAGAIGLGIAYFLLFNRQTRQGLHDLIAGTFVVKKGGAPVVINGPLPRVHWYVLGGLYALLAVVISVQTASQRRQVLAFERLEEQLRQIEAFDHVRRLEESGKTLQLGVQLKRPPESFDAVQRRVAGIALSAYPGIDQMEQMEVTVAWNCDLGILSRVVKWGAVLEERRKASVADWRQLALP